MFIILQSRFGCVFFAWVGFFWMVVMVMVEVEEDRSDGSYGVEVG